ncbi:MAG: hypothetical protein ACJ77A_14640 [Actinomycetota bacterium]
MIADDETRGRPGAGQESPQTPAGRGADVPAEQRGAVDEDRTPDPEPLGERSGGAGSAGGQVLESPGGPGTVDQEGEDKTLVEELVEEKETGLGEISPEMGTTKADPGAGGVRFDELVDKRRKGGLSDDEADELGRLMARREGRDWTSTRSLKAQPPDSPS